MSFPLVPDLDPTPLPRPPWLFHGLLVLTFFVHALFMNLTLGGTLLAARAQIACRGRTGDFRSILARRLMRLNNFGISLTITTGVAPLLFVQVLYQQYFYTAILIAWAWLLLLVMLTVGYCSVCANKFSERKSGRASTLWIVIAATMFLLIAVIHVSVNLIHSQPDRWAELSLNPWLILLDRTYAPRLSHFLLGSIGFSALVCSWRAARRAARGVDEDLNARIARYGVQWAIWTTLLEIADGIILTLALPFRVLQGVMLQGGGTMIPLTISILLGLGLLIMLSRIRDPVCQVPLITGCLATLVLTIASMSMTRHQVRVAYLGPYTSAHSPSAAPQWGNVLLFSVLLVLALVAVGYLASLVKSEPPPGERAA